MIVMKFGGSSVADAERIRAVADIVRERIDERPVVVVSALAGVTDLLDEAFDAAGRGELDALEPLLADLERRHRWALAGCIDDPRLKHHEGLAVDALFERVRQQLRSVRILGEGTARARDSVLACGERLSVRIVAAAFAAWGLRALPIEPEQIVATDDRHGRATPDPERVRARCGERLLPLLERGEIPVLGGFVGSSPSGETTTLGRGGSDTTAAIVGLGCAAREIQIWTDVDGMMSADPAHVPAARTLGRISFAEAAELALYGARVLHPDSIAPAVRRNIPVRVLNSHRPSGAGTLIVHERSDDEAATPVAIASKSGIGLVRVTSRRLPMEPTLTPRVLAACAAAGVRPELTVSSATTVTLAVDRPERLGTLEGLDDAARVEILPDCAIACIVGSALGSSSPLRERVLTELARADPELLAAGALRVGIVAVVARERLAEKVRELHARFFEGGSS